MIGAVERVRPKMMTVVAIMAGLLPIMWSTGTGSEVMQRIAVPMIGGMVSSTLLTLIVIPAVYGLVKGWRSPRAPTALMRRTSRLILKRAGGSVIWKNPRDLAERSRGSRTSLLLCYSLRTATLGLFTSG